MLVSAMLRSGLTIALVSIAAGAEARPVVMFPLDARGVAVETADRASAEMKRTLETIAGITVVETKVVEKRLGVHLVEQARACEYELFCLVEVGEILKSEQMIIGHVKRAPREPIDGELELKLFVLDVAKAVVMDTLVWKVPGGRERALEDAVAAATRKLFSPPPSRLVLEVQPPNAEIFAYGEPLQKTQDGTLPFWPGDYHLVIRAEGYQPMELKLSVSASGETRLKQQLQPDLLYVAKPKSKTVSPFDKTSRREGSGATALDVATDLPEEERDSPFSNLLAWGVTGAGAALAVAGVVIARGAQEDYNALAGDERYLITTTGADTAMTLREDARSTYRAASIAAMAGAAVAAGGFVWMLIDAALTDAPPKARSGAKAALLEVRW